MEVVDFVSLIFHSDTFSHWKFFFRKSSYAISRQMENSFIGEGFYSTIIYDYREVFWKTQTLFNFYRVLILFLVVFTTDFYCLIITEIE